MRNALSIDFEDWYRPFDARAVDGWQQYPSRIPQDTTRLLSLLEQRQVRCTFFVLGEVAERFPDAVRALHRAGHEIASHGYRHVPLYQQEPGQFEREMRRSLTLLEQLTGEPVRGFRAPFFSIRSDTLKACVGSGWSTTPASTPSPARCTAPAWEGAGPSSTRTD
jgi:hypothetical protein